MRIWFPLVVALVGTLAPLCTGGISREEYQSRRAGLRKSLDGVMVLFGANEPDDLHVSFFQEPNFLYLSGWREPGAVMMLTKNEEIIFLPERNLHMENYTGRKLGADDPDAAPKTGFAKVLPRSAIEPEFLRLAAKSERIYAISSDPQSQKLMQLAPLHDPQSAAAVLQQMRMVKSPAEIDLLEKAADASVAAHLAAWRRIRAGLYEYQIAATMVEAYEDLGCERSAYAPIVGAGPDSTILHYMSNRRRMDSGEVLLMDVGAECSDYASDVTRTVPVNGKFSPRQREIYEIVLGAQQAAIAAVKPGMKIRGGDDSLYQIAFNYINSHGKDLHGEPLGKYFTHGLSHHVGLDVHDLSDINEPLKAGMVFTIEPGIYIPEEAIGVRIEDTILVTETGSKNLSGALPREPDEIERLLRK
jgi:Xaa-Pro aminopeptidase